MSDLVTRLREAHPMSQQYANGSNLLAEAADEITKLQDAVSWVSALRQRLEKETARLDWLIEKGWYPRAFDTADHVSQIPQTIRANIDKMLGPREG